MPRSRSSLYSHGSVFVAKPSGRAKPSKLSKMKPLPTISLPNQMLVAPAPPPSSPIASLSAPPPAMFGHPSAPDLSQCVPVPLAAVPPLGGDGAASLRYWKARAEFVAQKTEYYERKCGELGEQLGFVTHALNDHVKKGRRELESVNCRLALALDENIRLSSLLAAALEKQKDYDSLVEDKRLIQSVVDSMTETLNLYMRDPLPGFEHPLMSMYPCDAGGF